MTAQMTLFKFEGAEEVRVVLKDGEPWFVAADLCGVLGLTNPTEVLRNIPESDVSLSLTEGNGGEREVRILSEPGMYRLVMRSDKPRALQFQQWLSKEVLPSLRKTGVSIPGISVEHLNRPRVQKALENVLALAAFEDMQDQQWALMQRQLELQKQQLEQQSQLIEHHGLLLQQGSQIQKLEESTATLEDYITIKGIAKRIGVKVDSVLAGMAGTLAGKLTRKAGLLVRETFDSTYGDINTYPCAQAEEALRTILANEPRRQLERQERLARKENKMLASVVPIVQVKA